MASLDAIGAVILPGINPMGYTEARVKRKEFVYEVYHINVGIFKPLKNSYN